MVRKNDAGTAPVKEDTLQVIFDMEAPEQVATDARHLAEQATLGKQGDTHTILVGTHASGHLHAERPDAFLTILTGLTNFVDDDKKALGRNSQVVVQTLAESLAALNVSCELAREHIFKYERKADDIKEVTVGESGRTVIFEEIAGAPAFGDMRVHADVPMPPGSKDMIDEYVKTAEITEDATVIYVGNHVDGFIHAKHDEEKGLWLCQGQGELDYGREIKNDVDVDGVVYELAQDLYSKALPEETIKAQARRVQLSESDIRLIEIGGNQDPIVFDADEPSI